MASDTTTIGATAVTADGTAVEIYRRLPSLGEVEHIRSLLAPNSSVLDLGAGTGRIAEPLADLGHRVTAVDDSAEMLAHIRRARTIQARIEELRLSQRFDAVLLAGNMFQYPGTRLRRSLLATVAHHLAPAGQAIIQWAPPQLLAARTGGSTVAMTVGTATTTLIIHSNQGGVVTGEFTLAADGQVWSQPVNLEWISAETAGAELERAGLVLTTTAPEESRWLHARRRH
ncbi:methyltransferase [Mycobacterium kansasii]|nr:methyltransferase [Mycobacterium kansasii]